MRTLLQVVAALMLALGMGLLQGFAPVSADVELDGKVPDFNLKDYNGKVHSLEQYKGKIVVLDFSSQKCPVSYAADPDISKLAKEYADKGVIFLGIDSNRDTKPDAIKVYAVERKIPFPIVKDIENKYADVMGATVTPEIYVVDREGKLAYHGKYDNRKGENDEASVNYTANAIDALLAGREVEVKRVKAVGCGINRVEK